MPPAEQHTLLGCCPPRRCSSCRVAAPPRRQRHALSRGRRHGRARQRPLDRRGTSPRGRVAWALPRRAAPRCCCSAHAPRDAIPAAASPRALRAGGGAAAARRRRALAKPLVSGGAAARPATRHARSAASPAPHVPPAARRARRLTLSRGGGRHRAAFTSLCCRRPRTCATRSWPQPPSASPSTTTWCAPCAAHRHNAASRQAAARGASGASPDGALASYRLRCMSPSSPTLGR